MVLYIFPWLMIVFYLYFNILGYYSITNKIVSLAKEIEIYWKYDGGYTGKLYNYLNFIIKF